MLNDLDRFFEFKNERYECELQNLSVCVQFLTRTTYFQNFQIQEKNKKKINNMS
jgi:hypothetical protein